MEQPEFIYWILLGSELIGVSSDDDTHFLGYRFITGLCAGCPGRLNKHYADIFIGQGKWRVITNPLEATALECLSQEKND